MRRRWKLVIGLAALAGISALIMPSTSHRALRELEATRRTLRQQGFKIELKEFNLTTSPEMRSRAALLGSTPRGGLGNQSGSQIIGEVPRLMIPAGSNAALVIWKLEALRRYSKPDLWPELRESLEASRTRLDAALDAALSGPIRFEPIGSQGPNPLMPYLTDVRQLEAAFGVQTMVALHDGQTNAAWTNLLAATCLVTEYSPEPMEIPHMVRFGCATIAFETTWNALQSDCWTGAQLAELQRRWESADFWSSLPETAAYSRANLAAAFEIERLSAPNLNIKFQDTLNDPRYLWFGLRDYQRRVRYQREGTYEDEKELLLYCRDRELELRRAVRCPTWSEMRQLPGVTNVASFRANNSSAVMARMNLQQVSLGAQGQGKGFLGRAAEAEARRRLIITAVAIERYHSRQGSYPDKLQELVPEFIASLPTDFMDGKPLRYRRNESGRFGLYSVGLDCNDDGGKMRMTRGGRNYEVGGGLAFKRGSSLVWPPPATAGEVEVLY
jgi:hypothetical protein